MDGPTLSQINTYQCQVCGLSGKPKFATNDQESWTVYRIQLKEGNIGILACPSCSSLLDISEIFEGYKARIKNGADLNYH